MTAKRSSQSTDLPGSELNAEKMPGHWILAQMGKRVLRPGGLGLTRALLDGLAIGEDDEVVEFAPGLGVTARMILDRKPRNYTGVERDTRAVQWTAKQLPRAANVSLIGGSADRTGLPDASTSVVIGEAMLTMQAQEQKRLIAAEAFRLLHPGGRYGIHELCVVPNDIPADQRQKIDRTLSSAIHIGARPLTEHEWKNLLEGAGFRVVEVGYAPMHLLRPRRLVQDEGVLGALRLAKNLLLDSAARRRVLAMRRVFEQYRNNLSAIFLIGQKGLD
jgi:hypothetical protein